MDKRKLLLFLRTHFNLMLDMDDEASIMENVWKGAELKGANLWVLIFAVVIASIGLNVNSTAVIIGAMLISPLMGPLIAIGVGLSVNDFDLIKFAAKNLGVALLFSLLASTIYFLITPLDQAQTELLARTNPTIFDAFIALAGGLAGMVANTRKVKGNVIPGVAIATALMPPLCTAGYGLASGNLKYFFGAFYLYFINSVFIFLGTYLIVRTMHFHKKEFVDKVLENRIRKYIYAITMVTVIPSGYLAYKMIHRTIIEKKVHDFLSQEVSGKGFVVIEKKVNNEGSQTEIEISAVGANLNEQFEAKLNKILPKYGLKDSTIKIKNVVGVQSDLVAIKTAIIQDLYRNNEEVIKNKDQKIALLEKELMSAKLKNLPIDEIGKELKINRPEVEEFIASQVKVDEKLILLAYIKHTGKIKSIELKKTIEWLKLRTKSEDVKLLTELKNKKFKASYTSR